MRPDFHAPQIKSLSRSLSLALLILAVLPPIMVCVVMATMSDAQFVASAIGHAPHWAELSTQTRVMATMLSVIPSLILSVGLLCIRPALLEMQSGRAFGKAAFRGLRRLAIAVVVSTVAKISIASMISVLLTWHAEEKQLALSFGLGDMQMLILGTALWLLAWVMAAGYAITSDNEQIV